MERPGTTEYCSLLPLCHFVTSATSPLCHFCRLLGWSCLCAASLLVSAAFSLLPLAWLVLLVRGLPSRFCRVLTSATCLVVSLTRGLRLVGPAWAGTAWNHRLFLANQTKSPPPHVFFPAPGGDPRDRNPRGTTTKYKKKQRRPRADDSISNLRRRRAWNHGFSSRRGGERAAAALLGQNVLQRT